VVEFTGLYDVTTLNEHSCAKEICTTVLEIILLFVVIGYIACQI
jgi:hypothetical protein